MRTSRSSTAVAIAGASFLAVTLLSPVHAVARPPCEGAVTRVAAGTWQARRVDGISGQRFNWRLTADETEPRFVLVADDRGILVTRDGGCVWERAVEYADFLAPFEGSALDAVIAGSGRERSLHVLVAPWMPFAGSAPPKLFSSSDDGATWTVVDTPAAAGVGAVLDLAASASVPGRVHLLANQSATGAVYAGSGEGEWEQQSVALLSASKTPCVPGVACPSRPLRSLHGDPSGDGLWGSAFGASDSDEALAYSTDGGVTWGYRPVPAMPGGAAVMDVASRSILLVGHFWQYAVSRDGGVSWAVGDYPKLTSSRSTSTGVFDVAHFGVARSSAVIAGDGPVSPWSGNVLVFEGSRWINAAPPAFAGYDRRDASGDPLSFAALASTDGPLLALSSRGELMAFRR